MNKYQLTYLALFLIIVILLLIFYRNQKIHSCDKNQNQWYFDQDEIAYHSKKKQSTKKHLDSTKPRYLFWTGGFDSTFLLLHNLIVLKKPVQPIYLVCSDVDSDNLLIQRKNKKVEIIIMKQIRKAFQEKYPHLAHNLLPTYYVTGVKIDPITSEKYQNIRKKYKHFESRRITQYERIARFSINFLDKIEIGLEKCGTGLDKATFDKRIRLKNGDTILDPNLPKSLDDFTIFKNLKFPIAHLTKEDMIKIAHKEGFYNLLEKSWSCWYPKIKNNKIYPCKKCPMCEKRPI